jgi:hypothetical protein
MLVALKIRSIFPPMRRAFLRLFFLFAITAGFTLAAEVEFLRVWPSWRDAESFERVGEYFGRPENTGREIALRTQPSERGGYYFLVRLKNSAALPDAKFVLSVIRPDMPEPKVYTFPAPVAAKETVFVLGLTGADWPQGKKANPVAWKIAVVDGADRVLAEHKSFLWEKPEK